MMIGTMVKHGISALVICIFSCLLLNSVYAQANHGPGRGPVALNCADEIKKFCAGKKHMHGEIRSCLEAHKAQVSDKCKNALETTGWGRKHHQK